MGTNGGVPILWLLVAGVLLAFVCGFVMRNTSGVRGTNEPGALAGNLALVFVLGIAALIAALFVVAALR